MSAFVANQDFQSSPNRESKPGKKRIPEANPVYVDAASPDDKVAASLVAIQEPPQHR
jgi:hypothetical protein